jgi:hypothetical protein
MKPQLAKRSYRLFREVFVLLKAEKEWSAILNRTRMVFSLFRLGITTSNRESYGWKNSETSPTEVSKPGCHKAQGN